MRKKYAKTLDKCRDNHYNRDTINEGGNAPKEFNMKKIFEIRFTYRDRNARGLKFKKAKRTIYAETVEEAKHKIENSINDSIIIDSVKS